MNTLEWSNTTQAWILLEAAPETRIWGPAVYFEDDSGEHWRGSVEDAGKTRKPREGKLLNRLLLWEAEAPALWGEFWEEMANIRQSWPIRMAIKLGKLSLTPGVIGWQLLPGGLGRFLLLSAMLRLGTKAENTSVCSRSLLVLLGRGCWVRPRQQPCIRVAINQSLPA